MARKKGQCRCGRKIPTNWHTCARCTAWDRQDWADPLAFDERMERFWGTRHVVTQGLNRPAELPVDAAKELFTGLGRRQQEADILAVRRTLQKARHAQVVISHMLDREEDGGQAE